MRGSRPLRHIPNEIYLEIFDLLRPGPFSSFSVQDHKAALSNLMLVCHFFRDICTPLRYASLEIKGTQKRHVDFCNAIRKSPRLVSDKTLAHVKQLSFSDWMPPLKETTWVMKGLLKVYSTTIDKFPNVTSISLVNVPIDSALFTAISQMRTLQEVTFTRCSFEPLTGQQQENSRKDTGHSLWTKLTFTENKDFKTYLPLLKALVSPFQTSFTTDHKDVAHAILEKPGSLDNLKVLSLPYSGLDKDFYISVLTHAHNIESLAFPVAPMHRLLPNLAHPVPFCLPAFALPKLKILQCPSWLVQNIVVGRPRVLTLDVSANLSCDKYHVLNDHDTYATPRVLDALKNPATQIRSLAVGVGTLESKGEQEFCVGMLEGLQSLTLYVSWRYNLEVRRRSLSTRI